MCMGGHGHGHGPGHGCCTFGGRPHGQRCCGGMMPGCCGPGWRRFISPAEELENLERYLEELKKEVAGVEARIRELKS